MISDIGVKWQEVSQNKTLSVEMEEMLMEHKNNTVVNITRGIVELPGEVIDNEKSIVDNTIHEDASTDEVEVKKRKREILSVNENPYKNNYDRLSSDYSIDSDYSSEEGDDDDVDKILIQVGYQNIDTPQYYPDFQIEKVPAPNRGQIYVNKQSDNIPLTQKYVDQNIQSEYHSHNIISNNEVPAVSLELGSSETNTFKLKNLPPKPIYIEEKERSKILMTETSVVSEMTTSSFINMDEKEITNDEARFSHRNKSQGFTLFPGIQNSMSVVQSALNSFRPTTSSIGQQSPLNNVKTMLDVIAGSNLSTEPSNDLKEDFVSQENCDEKLSNIHKHVKEIQEEIDQLSDSLLVMRAKSLIQKQSNSSFLPRNIDDDLKADIIRRVENYWKHLVSSEGTSDNTLKKLTSFPQSVSNYISGKGKTVEAERSHPPGSSIQASNLNPNKGNLDTIIDPVEVKSSHADIAVNQDSGDLNILVGS